MPPTNASPFKPICLTMAPNAGKLLDYDDHALELQTLPKPGDRLSDITCLHGEIHSTE